MPELLKVILLATVQGCAEFLPISSSGHLAILSAVLDINSNVLLLTVVLHAGTLLSILVYYFHFLLEILRKRDFRLVYLITISTLPTVVIGLIFKYSGLEELFFNNMVYPGIGLLITGIILKKGLVSGSQNDIEVHSMSFKKALAIGFAQGLAVLPGISRSGSTISMALKLGLRGDDAATFSFMLAIPVIAGASFLEIISAVSDNSSNLSLIPLAHLIVGFIVSAVVGFFSLKLLISTLRRNKLKGYAYYCIILGICVIIVTLF